MGFLVFNAMQFQKFLICLLGGLSGLLCLGFSDVTYAQSAVPIEPVQKPLYFVQDDRAQKVAFQSAPKRVVSLLPSITETLCALGQCARLVGVDRSSDWPDTVKQLPQLGGVLDPNIEAIVALKPDVVLLARSSRIDAKLESLGLKVLVFEPENQADVWRVIAALGVLFEVPEGTAQLQNKIQAGLNAAAQSIPEALKKTTVYFEIDSSLYAAGRSSFIGEMLFQLGMQNIVPESLGTFPKLNPEFVVRANPSVILVQERDAAQLAQRPGWNTIQAVQKNRLCRFTEKQMDILVRPGPRLAQAAHILAKCLREQLPAQNPL